jgi:hypothetical protein
MSEEGKPISRFPEGISMTKINGKASFSLVWWRSVRPETIRRKPVSGDRDNIRQGAGPVIFPKNEAGVAFSPLKPLIFFLPERGFSIHL